MPGVGSKPGEWGEMIDPWANGIYEPVLEPIATLQPNTSLPATTPGQAAQPEGRGTVELEQRFVPPTTAGPPALTQDEQAERQVAEPIIRAFDNRPLRGRTFQSVSTDVTDGTTGNVVLQLFEVPGGMEGRLTQVLVDVPEIATITPAAPYANASSWAFLAIAPPSSTDNDSSALALRRGMVAFAPTSAAGPILPGQWTFTDDQAPVARGGEMFYYVLIGGSIAAILSATVRARYRVNLYSSGAQ